jgi:sulfite reductase alpha subunit-like flavoprotein
VIELTLSLPDDFTLEYKPGDSIGILVSNTPKAVNFVLDFLHKNHGIKPSQKISVDSGNPVTVEEVINDYIDLCSPIKNKRILSSLSQYATDKNEEKILRLLASKLPLGERLFQSFIHEQRTSVVDILECFPSCQNITLEGLLAVIPGIAPRYYSISSSPLARKKGDDLSFNIAFSVVDYIVPSLFTDNDNNNSNDRRRVGGLATQYLEAICSPFLCRRATLGSSFSYSIPTVKIFPKPTAEFHLPPSLDTPLILVGPGTGVAPFMGFLHHRQAQIMSGDITEAAKTVSEGTWRGGYDIEEEDLSISKSDAKGLVIGADYRNLQEVGEVYLYFGCRYSDHDWLYKDEMTTFEKEKTVNNLQVAFSRENGDGDKIYVQDKIKGDAKQLTQMIVRKNAMIYICGDGNHMAKAVQSAFVSILAKENFSSEGTREHALAQANIYLEQMKVNKRFVMDIWS